MIRGMNANLVVRALGAITTPDCGTSRNSNTLAMIRNAGIEPEVIAYLTQPPQRGAFAKEDGERVIDADGRRVCR